MFIAVPLIFYNWFEANWCLLKRLQREGNSKSREVVSLRAFARFAGFCFNGTYLSMIVKMNDFD